MSQNTNVLEIKQLSSPSVIIAEYPNIYVERINHWRSVVRQILNKTDMRIMVIVGPCSIHDIESACEYANKLTHIRQMYPNLFIIMRCYFEKPRTITGWKGLCNDPWLNETYDIEYGLRIVRKFLLYCADIRLPVGCEFLDTISPQYLSDLVSFGAIGARTTESQIHRELASGLSTPIGFKNGTTGNVNVAIDAIRASRHPHTFLGIDSKGIASIIKTTGNADMSIILRGGYEPNYFERDILNTESKMINHNINSAIIVDCSHGNSQKIYQRQREIAIYVANIINRYRLVRQSNIVVGLMIESNIYEGNQELTDSNINTLMYGVSITDACISFETTIQVLTELNQILQ